MVKWSYQALEVTQAVCACVCGAVQASPLAVHQVVHLVPRQACAQQIRHSLLDLAVPSTYQ